MQKTFQSRMTALSAVFVMCAAIAGCGGGDEQVSVAPPPVVAPAPPPASPPAPPAPHLPTSAYLVVGHKIQLCQFSEDDASCNQDAGATGFEDMVAMAVSGSNAYISSVTGPTTIIHCTIEANGDLSGCVDTGNSTAEAVHGLTVHGSTLYIGGSSTPRVRMCNIQEDGSLGTCADAGFSAAEASDVEEIRFLGATAYLLHSGASRISKCTVRNDRTLSACADAGDTGAVAPSGFDVAGGYMYIADFETVIRCVVEPNGSLTGCMDAGVDVNDATQVAIRDSSVYITDQNGNFGVIRCTAGSDGFLTGCTKMYNQSSESIVLVSN